MTRYQTAQYRRWPESPLPVFDLGLAPYEPVQALQGRLRVAVADGLTPGALLLLEHEPVITLGSRGSSEDLRAGLRGAVEGGVGGDDASAAAEGEVSGAADDGARGEACYRVSRDMRADGSASRDMRAGASGESWVGLALIPVVYSERGGQATLHAPGQLVTYPVVPVPGRDLGKYVHNLEECLVAVLSGYGIRAERRPCHPGLYVDGRKIASVGLRCQRWVASHGTSLNVNIALTLFDTIVSCGEAELRQTSIESLRGDPLPMDDVKEAYVRTVADVFGWRLAPTRRLAFSQVENELGLHLQERPDSRSREET